MHTKRRPGKPLAGLKILDVGCGGGLLTEVSVCVCEKDAVTVRTETKISFPPLYIPHPLPVVSIPTFHITSCLIFPAVCCSVRFCFQCIIVPVLSHTVHTSGQEKHLNVSLILILFWFDWSQFGGSDSRSFTVVYLFVSGDSWAGRTGPLSLPSFDIPAVLCDLRRQNQVPCGYAFVTHTTKKQKVSVKIGCLRWSHHYTPSHLKGSALRGWTLAPWASKCSSPHRPVCLDLSRRGRCNSHPTTCHAYDQP